MKGTILINIFAVAAAALPAFPGPYPVNEYSGIDLATLATEPAIVERQSGSTANELESGACRRITFIFARGSTEAGNLGTSTGPATCNALKSRYGASNVACQGVGGPYTADLLSNTLPQGTTTAAINEASRLFNLARSKCPQTIITAGGYSQGAAVMTYSVAGLSSAVMNQIAGVVLYGDTRNQQTAGRIPNFSTAKTLIICAPGDRVCDGTLIITPAHGTYLNYVSQATTFLAGRIGS